MFHAFIPLTKHQLCTTAPLARDLGSHGYYSTIKRVFVEANVDLSLHLAKPVIDENPPFSYVLRHEVALLSEELTALKERSGNHGPFGR